MCIYIYIYMYIYIYIYILHMRFGASRPGAPGLFSQIEAQEDPKRTPKMVPKWSQNGPKRIMLLGIL